MDKLDLIRTTADLLDPLAIDAPPQHWLQSDATNSYCWPCARQAAWEEQGHAGTAPAEVRFYERTPEEEALRQAIDGGEWYSGSAECSQSCTSCGCTLQYNLTATGVSYEIEAFEADSLLIENLSNPSCVYELKQLFEAIDNVDESESELIDAVYNSALKVRELLEEPYTPAPERMAA